MSILNKIHYLANYLDLLQVFNTVIGNCFKYAKLTSCNIVQLQKLLNLIQPKQTQTS